MAWLGKLGSVYAFKGIKDYEEWAMGMTPPQPPVNPLEGFMGEGEWEVREWTPEEFAKAHAPLGEKDRLYAQATELRKQINDALVEENYERAEILQKTLDIIKMKYDRL